LGAKRFGVNKKLCANLLQKKNTITFYDVGANIGTHTLALSKTFGEKIKIRAFEAQSSVFNMLCGTLALNSIYNVYPHHLAVSDKDNQIIKMDPPDYTKKNNFGGFEVLPPKTSDNQSMRRSGKTELVKTVKLDSFEEPVDFIKMDIEGMEHLAMQGATGVLENHRPYLFVGIIKTDKEQLFDILTKNNYKIYIFDGDALCIPQEQGVKVIGVDCI
jgi:FkbM family methyltransferase